MQSVRATRWRRLRVVVRRLNDENENKKRRAKVKRKDTTTDKAKPKDKKTGRQTVGQKRKDKRRNSWNEVSLNRELVALKKPSNRYMRTWNLLPRKTFHNILHDIKVKKTLKKCWKVFAFPKKWSWENCKKNMKNDDVENNCQKLLFRYLSKFCSLTV